MIRTSDIIARINGMLKKEWPDISRRGIDAEDSAKPPYFIVEVHWRASHRSMNLWRRDAMIYITYDPLKFDQTLQDDMGARIEELIGRALVVKDRVLTVNEFDSNILDKKFLQCEFHLVWDENVVDPETEPLMKELEVDFVDKEN